MSNVCVVAGLSKDSQTGGGRLHNHYLWFHISTLYVCNGCISL